MSSSQSRILRSERTPWHIVGAGIAALAVAMGIGRFAFTPLLPLMLRDGTLDIAAGVFSAWALVCTSSWGLAELARRHAPQLGAWIYSGVGLGIALAGALAWLGGQQSARWLWLEMGMLAAAGAIFVGRKLGQVEPSAAPPKVVAGSSSLPPGANMPLVLCYGTFGFGYIVPATFLPAMARQQVSDPLVFGLTWPLFGLAATLSVAVAARYLSTWPRGKVWALAQGTMALGTALPLLTQALWALGACALLVGGTFMVATMAGLQLARELRPSNPTPLLARMTVAFAAGQILGPSLVRALGARMVAGHDALAWANAAATGLLLLTAAWLWRMTASSPT